MGVNALECISLKQFQHLSFHTKQSISDLGKEWIKNLPANEKVSRKYSSLIAGGRKILTIISICTNKNSANAGLENT